MFRVILIFASTVIVVGSAHASDWPQWLGPNRDGVSTEKVDSWKEAPAVVWRHEIGSGYSSPVVANGRTFVHARVGDQQEEELVAFDAISGKLLWREKYARTKYSSVLGAGPAATPTVSANKIFAFGISGMLICHDADTGQERWKRDVYEELKVPVPRYGVCCSPLVVGNRVIVSVGGKGTAIVALDTESGEYAWKAFDEPATTSSPILYRAPGQELTTQSALFVTSLRLLALDPLDGQMSWEAPQQFKPSGPAPTPLNVGDIVITSNSNDGTIATRITTGDDGVKSAQLWRKPDVGGYFSSGVRMSDDKVCLVTNVLKPIPSASLKCLDLKTGNEAWSVSGVGYFHAGVIKLANDRLLVLDDAGTVKLFDVGEGKCTELAKTSVCKGNLVTPAFANGLLYARDGGELICVRLGAP